MTFRKTDGGVKQNTQEKTGWVALFTEFLEESEKLAKSNDGTIESKIMIVPRKLPELKPRILSIKPDSWLASCVGIATIQKNYDNFLELNQLINGNNPTYHFQCAAYIFDLLEKSVSPQRDSEVIAFMVERLNDIVKICKKENVKVKFGEIGPKILAFMKFIHAIKSAHKAILTNDEKTLESIKQNLEKQFAGITLEKTTVPDVELEKLREYCKDLEKKYEEMLNRFEPEVERRANERQDVRVKSLETQKEASELQIQELKGRVASLERQLHSDEPPRYLDDEPGDLQRWYDEKRRLDDEKKELDNKIMLKKQEVENTKRKLNKLDKKKKPSEVVNITKPEMVVIHEHNNNPELENQLVVLKAKAENAAAEKAELNKEIRNLLDQMQTKREEILNLTSDNRHLNEKIEASRLDGVEKNERMRILQGQLLGNQDLIEYLEKKCKNLEMKVLQLSICLTGSNEENKRLVDISRTLTERAMTPSQSTWFKKLIERKSYIGSGAFLGLSLGFLIMGVALTLIGADAINFCSLSDKVVLIIGASAFACVLINSVSGSMLALSSANSEIKEDLDVEAAAIEVANKNRFRKNPGYISSFNENPGYEVMVRRPDSPKERVSIVKNNIFATPEKGKQPMVVSLGEVVDSITVPEPQCSKPA